LGQELTALMRNRPKAKLTRRELTSTVRRSREFVAWPGLRVYVQEKFCLPSDTVVEKQFSSSELAGVWGLSIETIRRMFEKTVGVLRIAVPNVRKRQFTTFLIPLDAATRVHQRFLAAPNRARNHSRLISRPGEDMSVLR
jgi:hypothetical protein